MLFFFCFFCFFESYSFSVLTLVFFAACSNTPLMGKNVCAEHCVRASNNIQSTATSNDTQPLQSVDNETQPDTVSPPESVPRTRLQAKKCEFLVPQLLFSHLGFLMLTNFILVDLIFMSG
jgi:hypothetical protein